jgi:hypothetical protein
MSQHWIRALMLHSAIPLLLLAGCASSTDSYDKTATENTGRIVGKKSVGSFQRTVESPGGSSAAIAAGGYLGYIIARGLFSQSTKVELFEYSVALKDGRQLNVVSEWGLHEVGACVRTFESPSGRKDYPRLTSDTSC